MKIKVLKSALAIAIAQMAFPSKFAIEVVEMIRTLLNHFVQTAVNASKLLNTCGGPCQLKLNLNISQFAARATATQDGGNYWLLSYNSRVELAITYSLPSLFPIIGVH